MAALSAHAPTLPIDPMSLLPFNARTNAFERNWEPVPDAFTPLQGRGWGRHHDQPGNKVGCKTFEVAGGSCKGDQVDQVGRQGGPRLGALAWGDSETKLG